MLTLRNIHIYVITATTPHQSSKIRTLKFLTLHEIHLEVEEEIAKRLRDENQFSCSCTLWLLIFCNIYSLMFHSRLELRQITPSNTPRVRVRRPLENVRAENREREENFRLNEILRCFSASSARVIIISNRSVTWVSPDDGCVEYNFKTHNTLKRWQNVEIELEKSSMDLDMADDDDDGGRWWTRRDDEKAHGRKVPRRKMEIELNCCNEAIPRSLDHVLLSNSVPAEELELFIGHYLVFLAFFAPSFWHVEQFKNETFFRLFFAATACSCLFAPVDSVCNYLFLPFSRAPLCFIVKCL